MGRWKRFGTDLWQWARERRGGGAEKILLLFLPLSNIRMIRIRLLSEFPKTHHQVSKTFFVPYEICFIVPLTKKLPVKLNSTIIAGDIISKTPKFISRHCKGKRGDLPRQGRGRRGGRKEGGRGSFLTLRSRAGGKGGSGNTFYPHQTNSILSSLSSAAGAAAAAAAVA